tara:strand:- start:56 stop:424 length:369 start_codon:yes stop_codon:yes gene_type:complete
LIEDDVVEELPEDVQPCNAGQASGGEGETITDHDLGSVGGVVNINYDMDTEPDKMEVYYDGVLVTSTFEIRKNDNGFVGGGNRAGAEGTLSFQYIPSNVNYCTVIVTGGLGTSWAYILECPK